MASESPDNSDTEASNDEELPRNESSLTSPRNVWDTGMRRRRRGDTTRSHEAAAGAFSRQYRAHDSATSHHTNTGISGGTMGLEHHNPGLDVGGSCSNGTVSALSTHADGGAGRLTPSKPANEKSPPIEEMASSATISGETAESTVISSPRSMDDRGRRTAPSLQRQYRIFQSQIYFLLGTTSIGFVLFLILTLPFFALICLALMVASLAALGPVASAALRARYQMELEHPLGLLRYLPDSIRIMLTETTLHEYMTDTTAFMENRYLLLYFVPGLQPDQLMNFINQLPPRHRNTLLQPGLGRLMPSIMGRLMRIDDSRGETGGTTTPLLQNGGRGDMSTSSLLTIYREEMEHTESIVNSEIEVSFLEAISSLRQTLTGQLNPDTVVTTQHAAASAETPRILGEDTATSSEGEGGDGIQDDDASSSILGGGVGLTGVVLVPQSTNLIPDQNAEQRLLQQEYDIEERVLSEATSAAVANYSAQASAAVSDNALGAVEAVSSWIIRIGSLTGLFAGSGSIALAAYARPSSITLGLFALPGTRNGTSSNYQRNDSTGARRVVMYGLLATSALGFASAGLSYFIRNRVRAAMARTREDRENKTIEPTQRDDIDSERKER